MGNINQWKFQVLPINMVEKNKSLNFRLWKIDETRNYFLKKIKHIRWVNKKKKALWPLFMDGVQLLQGYSHFEEAVYSLHEVPRNTWYSIYRLGRMKGYVALGGTTWFWTQDTWIGNPAPWRLGHCSWSTKNFQF